MRSADDVMQIRQILEEHDADIHIIAKIENGQGVAHIEEILTVSDGLMVARGDLGVEVPTEQVPLLQKMIFAQGLFLAGNCQNICRRSIFGNLTRGRTGLCGGNNPVITATQMLDSMIRNPRPTRAEANDVANAIFDGTDAVMLSGETTLIRLVVPEIPTGTPAVSTTTSPS